MDVNLLVDTNNLFNRVTHSLERFSKLFEKKVKFDDEIMLASDEEVELFVESINSSFNRFLKEMPPVSRVFFLQDSKSWRKKILIDGEATYKKSRSERKGKKMNWENFEKGFEMFMEENPEFYNYRIYGLEADDLMYLVSDRLKNLYPNDLNIIYSTDSDFHQLLDDRNVIYNPLHSNPRFIINDKFHIDVFKNIDNEGVFLKSMKKDSENPFDLTGLNFKHNYATDSNSIITNLEERHDIEYSDAKQSIFNKFISGDKKDDVPSCFYWEYEGKTRRVTPKFTTAIYERFKKEGIDISLKGILTRENVEIIQEVILEKMTAKEKKANIKVPLKELARNLKRNRLLLYLSEETIPKKLISKFDLEFSEDF